MLFSFSWMNNALASCRRKLFGGYATIQVGAIAPKAREMPGQAAAVFN